MVLVLTETGSESVSDIAKKLDLEDRITPKEEVNEGRPTALFVASLPLNKGYQEGMNPPHIVDWGPYIDRNDSHLETQVFLAQRGIHANDRVANYAEKTLREESMTPSHNTQAEWR
ncbi:hypothetical protein H0H92_002915 [Tricholoma furcatifolium]|nr:hypothetical protein H0H92_002915 [Tricholoma furcatifolium]